MKAPVAAAEGGEKDFSIAQAPFDPCKTSSSEAATIAAPPNKRLYRMALRTQFMDEVGPYESGRPCYKTFHLSVYPAIHAQSTCNGIWREAKNKIAFFLKRAEFNVPEKYHFINTASVPNCKRVEGPGRNHTDLLTSEAPLQKIIELMPKKVAIKKKLNRRQRDDLDIEIGFIEGVVQRDPLFVEALQILGDDYTRRGQFLHGLRVDERLAALRPEDPTVLYNLACSYALTDQVMEAIAVLSRAIDQGYSDFKWLLKDPDLKKLRADPSFSVIQQKIRTARLKL